MPAGVTWMVAPAGFVLGASGLDVPLTTETEGVAMLVLGRKPGQSITIRIGNAVVTVERTPKGLSVNAPRGVSVLRTELLSRLDTVPPALAERKTG